MSNDTQKLLTPISENAAGGVVIDNRGRNIWQWKDSQIDNTSIVLKRLENDALQLEPTRNVPVLDKAGRKKVVRPEREARSAQAQGLSISATINVKLGGGFDPYNRS